MGHSAPENRTPNERIIMKCRNCDKQLKVGEFVSQSVLFPGEVLTTVEHEDGTLF